MECTQEIVAAVHRPRFVELFTDPTHLPKWQEGVRNLSANEFHEAGPGSTRWVARNVFTFTGPMRIAGLLFAKSFPRQSWTTMEAFRRFAESEPD